MSATLTVSSTELFISATTSEPGGLCRSTADSIPHVVEGICGGAGGTVLSIHW